MANHLFVASMRGEPVYDIRFTDNAACRVLLYNLFTVLLSKSSLGVHDLLDAVNDAVEAHCVEVEQRAVSRK